MDNELLRRGLARSRAEARRLIEAGRVTVAGAPVRGPSRLVAPHEAIRVSGPPDPYVGRGGHKLAGALDRWDVAVRGRRALDVGASTGGFTDCLLQRGAEAVIALDVGHGQLHPRLRADPRVVVMERCNARHLVAGELPWAPEVVVVDVSFISLRLLAEPLVGVAGPAADWCVLVKPQFEVGRREATRHRGVIRDPALWEASVRDVVGAWAAAGTRLVDVCPAHPRGADGNVEFFAWFRREPAGGPTGDPVGDRGPGRAPDPPARPRPATDPVTAAVAEVLEGAGTGP